MSIEKTIREMQSQLNENTDDQLNLTKEDLENLTEEEIKSLIENFDQLDEVSKETLAQYVAEVPGTKETDNAEEDNRKIRAKAGEQDKTELENDAVKAKGPESKDFNIKKGASFEKGDQTEVIENTDLGSLFEGEQLSEEFKSKATTIFESAVAARVVEELDSYKEEFDSLVEGLIDKVDGFLSYVAEQWVQKNELALERGIKSEMFESFMSGMKDLFVEHYVNVPEEQLDVLESIQEEKEALEQQLDEATANNIELSKVLRGIQKEMQIEEASEGLSDVQAEKFRKLVENIVYEDEESYSQKLETIRENYFSQNETADKKQKVEFMTDSPVESLTEEVISPEMAAYTRVFK